MSALVGEANLNASVRWAGDEMTAFGRVHLMTMNMAPSQGEQHVVANKIIAYIQVSGLSKCSHCDWTEFVNLRAALPTTIVNAFQTCRFNARVSRVRCPSIGLWARSQVGSKSTLGDCSPYTLAMHRFH